MNRTLKIAKAFERYAFVDTTGEYDLEPHPTPEMGGTTPPSPPTEIATEDQSNSGEAWVVTKNSHDGETFLGVFTDEELVAKLKRKYPNLVVAQYVQLNKLMG